MNARLHIKAYLDQWLDTPNDYISPISYFVRNFNKIDQSINLIPEIEGKKNYVNAKGYSHLRRAAELILDEMGEQRKVSISTAMSALGSAHNSVKKKSAPTGIISEHAILDAAKRIIRTTKRTNGTYVYPLVFTLSDKDTDVKVGSVQIMSTDVFKMKFGNDITKSNEAGGFNKTFSERWSLNYEEFDHFLCVAVNDHEEEMARKVGREASEFVLNVIRLNFGFSNGKAIRLGGDFLYKNQLTDLFISESGEIMGKIQSRARGASLVSDWFDRLDKAGVGFVEMLSSYANWVVSGKNASSPVLERLGYANTLLAEAYSEPINRLRLVRLVAALEALALPPRQEKTHELAYRCACAGGWSDTGIANTIYETVRDAYRVRNDVVHGDSPKDTDVWKAFSRLERNMFWIFFGFMFFFIHVENEQKPQSIKQLRRIVHKRLELFFWSRDIF